MDRVAVFLNEDRRGTTRKEVAAEVVRRNGRTVIVRLPDGHHVKRKIARDVPSLRFEVA